MTWCNFLCKVWILSDFVFMEYRKSECEMLILVKWTQNIDNPATEYRFVTNNGIQTIAN